MRVANGIAPGVRKGFLTPQERRTASGAALTILAKRKVVAGAKRDSEKSKFDKTNPIRCKSL